VHEDRIRVVPGAVDLARFRPVNTRTEARQTLGWPVDRPILLTVRRLFHRMGLRQLVEAMPVIKDHVPEVFLCIGGAGPIRPLLEARVRDLQLINNVRFLGFIPDDQLASAYHAADITVLPTVALEGFGLVAAESLAAGTPAMVTSVGGLPAVVEGLSQNLIFRSERSEDLASGLTAALRGHLRLPGEIECREYAERNFCRKIMAARTAAVYRELIT
jgi:glycosyltransferase involved in cell wall biosynthesis